MYHEYNKGLIEVICGCMFAGKTQELIRRLSTLKYTKQKIICFKPEVDNRYGNNHIKTHKGTSINAISIKNAKEILNYDLKKIWYYCNRRSTIFR